MCVYLRAKFEVFSIIPVSFRQNGGEESNQPTHLKTNP